ncbi:MAG: L-threonylcarbamoyladenylate synthase [Candidatus Altiarchaeota archaeon]
MRILKVGDWKSSTVSEIAGVIRSGSLLVYPTDTVYGIGCSILSDAVDRVFGIKGREKNKPLSIAVSSMQMLEEYATITDEQRAYITNMLQEPYTFVVNKRNVPDRVTAGLKTVGIRVLYGGVMGDAIAEAGVPVVSTSANVAGHAPPASVSEIDQSILEAVDLVIDGGRCPVGKPSRIIDLASGRRLR